MLVEVRSARLRHTNRRNLKIVEASLADDSGPVKAVWFNQAYLAERLQPGHAAASQRQARPARLSRHDTRDRRRRRSHAGRARPGSTPPASFPCTTRRASSRPTRLREWAWQALALAPDAHRAAAGRAARAARALRRGRCAARRALPGVAGGGDRRARAARLRGAVPASGGARGPARGAAAKSRAGNRDRRRRASWSAAGSHRLPFELTGDQRAACAEIDADLAAGKPMQRLLMGEVGSGKTAVAVYAMLRALEAGHQAALMAPTETLAEQHAATLDALLGRRGDPVRAADRGDQRPPGGARRWRGSASGELGLIVGTHALIEPDVAVLRARRLHRRRAAPLRRPPARGARRQGPGRRGAARPAHDRDADPADALADRLRRPRHDDDPPAARGPPADQDLGGGGGASRRRLRVHPRAPARGPPGLRRLPAGRGLGEAAGEGGERRGRAAARGRAARTSRSSCCTARCRRARRRRRWSASRPGRPTCSSRRR